MWSPSYGCFSTGMHDDCVTLAGSYSRPCSILPTALDSHAGKPLLCLKPELQQAKPTIANR